MTVALGWPAGMARSQDAQVVDPATVDPAVETLLLSDPTTPAEMIHLARILVDLDAPAAAKPLIEQVIAAQPDGETLADLADRFGTATFVRFQLLPELNPEATQLADAVLTAARQRAVDPRRIAALIAQLGDLDERPAAIQLLRSGRSDSVNALLSVLVNPSRAAEHEQVKTALVGQQQEASGPLLAALASPDPALRAHVAQVLGRLGDSTLSDYLLAPAHAPDETPAVRAAAQAALRDLLGQVPDPFDATERLTRRALRLYEGQDPRLGVASGPESPAGIAEAPEIEIWAWNAADNQAVAQHYPPAAAALEMAVRLAADARRLAPENRTIRRLHLGTLLESAMVGAGRGEPLPVGAGTAIDRVAAEGVGAVTDLLSHSMASGHTDAAAAAATILGRLGDVELLHQGGAVVSPLVEAMRHDDRRVRFAAVGAIMTIDPRRPYPGSSYLPKALEYFLTSAGRPRALVAGVDAQEVQRQAGMLIELGYDAEAVYASADIQRVAVASSDHELLLVDVTMAWPTSGELIQRLRRDGRTARLPIAVVTPLPDKRRAERLARQFELVEAIIRPPHPQALRFQIAPLLASRGQDHMTAAQRLNQAAAALTWAARLSSAEADVAPRQIYDLSDLERPLLRALWTPELSARAADVLAQLGQPAGQRALVDLASRSSQPLALRQASAQAFGQSVHRHGILLTSSEMLQQYDRYNQSEFQDRQTQSVLGSILDTLERQ